MTSTAVFVLLIGVLAYPASCVSLPSILPTSPILPTNSSQQSDTMDGTLTSIVSTNVVFATLFTNLVTAVNYKAFCENVPDSVAEILLSQMNLYLCYGPNTTDCQIESLSNANNLFTGGDWDPSRKNVLFVPGWTNSATSSGYSAEVIKAYNQNGTYNLFILDWNAVNNQSYTTAVALMPRVAPKVATALDAMGRNNSGFRNLTFVGHSLGAHLAGYISRNVSVVRIIFLAALDPAGPLFFTTMWKCQEGVSATDALFVISIHSNWNRFGGNENVGSVDCFPNNGSAVQPGCNELGSLFCSHERSLFYWLAAIEQPSSVLGRHCPSASLFAAKRCANNAVLDVTQPTDKFGTYFFTTNPVNPFGRGLQGT